MAQDAVQFNMLKITKCQRRDEECESISSESKSDAKHV